MTIFLILAPYGVFSLLMLVTSATASVFAAAAICLMVIAFDVVRGRSIKILGVGSAIVFAAIGGYLAFVDPTLSTSVVKFAVDTGIFLVSLQSIVIRRDQPYGRWVKDLFDVQQYPGGQTPYDVAGWTLPLLLGVECVEVRGALDAKTHPLARTSELDKGFAADPRTTDVAFEATVPWDMRNEDQLAIDTLRDFRPVGYSFASTADLVRHITGSGRVVGAF